MYEKMYYHLFNTITDALKEADLEKVKELLMRGQIDTEEMYINYEPPETIKLSFKNN